MASHARGTLTVAAGSGPPRRTRWIRRGALDGRPLVVLAHGAGAPMTSPFMEHVTAALVERGLAVARFDFPYMERARLEGRRRPPDASAVLLATWRTMLEAIPRWRGAPGPRVVGGKSLGGRMASMELAQGTPPDVVGAVYLGYPLHPAGRPERLRVAHLAEVAVEQLFVAGSRDGLATLATLRREVERLGPRARLHVVEGGDHSLARSRREPFAGSDAWLDAVAAFVREVAS